LDATSSVAAGAPAEEAWGIVEEQRVGAGETEEDEMLVFAKHRCLGSCEAMRVFEVELNAYARLVGVAPTDKLRLFSTTSLILIEYQ
jgi:NADH:ubiquinone oxidoreductase subunit E